MPLPLRLTLKGGGEAEIVETDGDRVVLRASIARPPGAPLSGSAEGEAREYHVKVRGCRRVSDERGEAYLIEARFIDLTRRQRIALLG